MKADKEQSDSLPLLTKLRTSENPYLALVRELLWVVVVVGGIALALFLVSGTWPAVVTIESQSMDPHMKVGDLVFVVTADRFGPLQTLTDGKVSGYRKFEEYGDVVIYRPNGGADVHPIIHRAMSYVQAGETLPADLPGVKGNFTSPSEGYITKGDNNAAIDQIGPGLTHYGKIQPVKKEWLVGKAIFSVPLFGYLPLNILPVALILIAIMVIHEIWLARKHEQAGRAKSGKKGRKSGKS